MNKYESILPDQDELFGFSAKEPSIPTDIPSSASFKIHWPTVIACGAIVIIGVAIVYKITNDRDKKYQSQFCDFKNQYSNFSNKNAEEQKKKSTEGDSQTTS
jgi:hypothetical protein